MTYIKGYIFDTNDKNFLIEFSSVDEWSMSKYCSPVRIMRNADKKLMYENSNLAFLIDPFDPAKAVQEFNRDQVILLRLLRQPSPNIWKYPGVLFNLTKAGFYLIDGVALEFISLGDKLQVIEKFKDKHSETKTLELNSINWTPIEELINMK